MDAEAQALEAALGVLRRQFGNRLVGEAGETLAQMRQTLARELGADEVAADRLVKQLMHLRRLTYQGTPDDRPGIAGAAPFALASGGPAAQGVVGPGVPSAGLVAASVPDIDQAPLTATSTATDGATAEGIDDTTGYWQIA